MNETMLQAIKETVEKAVDEKINGKLVDIKKQLNSQDETLSEVKDLLRERKFLIQLWSFLKFIGGMIVAIGSAILLFQKIK